MEELLKRQEEDLLLNTIGMNVEFTKNKHNEYVKYLWDLFDNCVVYETRNVIKKYVERYYQVVPRPEDEWWKPAIGYDYLRISNYARAQFTRDWHNHKAGDFYKPCVNNGGYLTVNGRTLHSIMLENFSDEKPNGRQCDHINNIRFDCRADNLQYLSSSDNQKKSGNNKKRKHNNGPVLQFNRNHEFVAEWTSAAEAVRTNNWKKGDIGGISYAALHGTPLKGSFWKYKNNVTENTI